MPRVVGVTAGSTNGNSVTTAGVDTTGADLLVVSVGQESGVAICAVTDSKGNVWTQLTAQVEGGIRSVLFWSKPTSVGAGHTFTATQTGSLPAIAVEAWSNSKAAPFDQQNGNHNAVGTTLATGSVTPSEANEVIFAGFAGRSGSGAIVSIDAGFTIGNSTTAAGATNDTAGIAYLAQGAAAAVNPTWTVTSSGSVKAAAIATFKFNAPAVAGANMFLLF